MNTTATEEINQWIQVHGSERDALNVALTRLQRAQDEIKKLKENQTNYAALITAAKEAVDSYHNTPASYSLSRIENSIDALDALLEGAEKDE